MADKVKEKKVTRLPADGGRRKMKQSGTEPGRTEAPSKKTTKMENVDLLAGTLKEDEDATDDLLQEKLQIKEKVGKLPADEPLGPRVKETTGKMKDPEGTTLFSDEYNEDVCIRIVTENTYQLGPTKRFPVIDATNILREVLSSSLKGEKYEVQQAQELSLALSVAIRERVKALKIPRYKIVVLVTIGQLSSQSIQSCSRCLWDSTNDTFASYSFKNSSLFGVASVYAVYFE
ncbi:tctex1 domain-containing protein 1-B-like [Nematolebias whitei]|uniref:tctex1 domain-containing protein 1-B-like n=1 Tax=Nematolebias whitei TaxID=451745 RepID=UPI00189AD83D|nr:tctex1 domain-containing protein 1-B-like [Nematolebias whitei]